MMMARPPMCLLVALLAGLVPGATTVAAPPWRALQAATACPCEVCVGKHNSVADCESFGIDCSCYTDGGVSGEVVPPPPPPIATCESPPNGGCDPHTTCSEGIGLSNINVVTCSACPAGYYGSGRTGCFDVNECTLRPNGGCDHRTACTNFEGGYACSPCGDVVDPTTHQHLTGDSSAGENSCHLPPPPSCDFSVLEQSCGKAKRASVGNCLVCVVAALKSLGGDCQEGDSVDQFCHL